MCSQVLLREHADTHPRGGQQLVLLPYFSWAHTSDLTFLARNQMETLISITLLEISLQVSGRGFCWILVLLALERQRVPGARREDRAELGSQAALRGVQHQQGSQAGLTVLGQWVLQMSRRGDPWPWMPILPRAGEHSVGQQGSDHPRVPAKCELVVLQSLGAFLGLFCMCKAFCVIWSQIWLEFRILFSLLHTLLFGKEKWTKQKQISG